MPETNTLLPEQTYIIVGQFARTFGVSGWIKINSFTHPIANLGNYAPWYIRPLEVQDWSIVPIAQCQIQQDGIIALIEGYDSPEAVRVFTGMNIAVKRSQLPELPEGDYFWCDLLGLDVVTTTGALLGKVVRLFHSGANDILVIQGEKEHMVPFIETILY